MAADVWKHYFGEACLAISAAAAVGARVAAGVVAADSAAVVVLEAGAVSEEVSVVAAILAEEAPVAVGSGTDSASIDSTPNNYG